MMVRPPLLQRIRDRVGVDTSVVQQACAVAPRQKLAGELAKAARYVQALLPAPQAGPVEVDWVFRPSAELGGDAFGYHWLDDDHFALYLFDVCGHGIVAALHSVSVLNVLRTQSLRGADFYAPSEVLAALNEAFQMKRFDNMYFTIWYGVFNRKTRRLTYATGGHPPALLVTDAAGRPCIERLRTKGLLIGGVRGVAYPSVTRVLPAGSALYLFSDGVYELRQSDGTMMDLDDFIDLLAEQTARGKGDVHRLLQHIDVLRDCATCMDDTALLQITFH